MTLITFNGSHGPNPRSGHVRFLLIEWITWLILTILLSGSEESTCRAPSNAPKVDRFALLNKPRCISLLHNKFKVESNWCIVQYFCLESIELSYLEFYIYVSISVYCSEVHGYKVNLDVRRNKKQEPSHEFKIFRIMELFPIIGEN